MIVLHRDKLLSSCLRAAYGVCGMLLLGVNAAYAFVGLDPAYSGVDYGSQPSAARGLDVGEGGGVVLYPAIGIGATYDDNIYRENEDASSAMIYTLLPVIEARKNWGASSFLAGYKGNYGRYSGGPNDDLDSFTDHNAYLGAAFKQRKTGGNITADYTRGHTPKGANNSEEKDTWDQYSVLGWLDFGAQDARFRLRLTGLGKNREYDLNEAIDLKNTGVGAVFGVRVASKTRLVLDGGITRYDYENSNNDGDRSYLRAGVSWAATGKTTGIFTYGYQKYKADNPGEEIDSDVPGTAVGTVQDSDTTSWRGEIVWSATTKDIVNFDTSRNTVVSYGIGTNRNSTRTRINWGHSWTEKVGSSIGYTFGDDEYIGFDRDDDIQLLDIGLSYKPGDNHTIRGGYYYENRDSNIDFENYRRNRVTLLYGYEF